jgi:hypothetical protein
MEVIRSTKVVLEKRCEGCMLIRRVQLNARAPREACMEVAAILWVVCIDHQLQQFTLQWVRCLQIPENKILYCDYNSALSHSHAVWWRVHALRCLHGSIPQGQEER